MKTSELLTKTAQTLKERGHTKFCLEQRRADGRPGEVCLMGAMNLALRSNSAYPAPYPAVYQDAMRRVAVVAECPKFVNPQADKEGYATQGFLVGWNNHTARTQAEVIQAVEAAAAAALADGD